MQNDDPDVWLMIAFQAGDEAALSDLYGRWAGPLFRSLERLVRNRAMAEDLVQDALTGANREIVQR